jgi:hypothetical protein
MADQKKIACWLVRCYDEEGDDTSFVILDRTEHEARREAEADERVLSAADWSMTETKWRGDAIHG